MLLLRTILLWQTSDQPLFSSANFSPFTSAEALLKKDGRYGVRGDPAPSDTPSHSDTDLAVPFADDSTDGDEEQDADCVFCTGRFSEDHNGEY